MTVRSFISSKINELVKIQGAIKSRIVLGNEFCKRNGVYSKAKLVISEICLWGIFAWISVIPFIGVQNVWYIPCYGVGVWIVFEFVEEMVRRIKHVA